jgi:hypothetical protein
VGESKDGELHHWAHHLSPDGSPAPGWPAGGLRLDSSDVAPVAFVADGAQGLLVIGRSPGSGPGITHIVVRRWNASAITAPGWPAAGVPFVGYSIGSSVYLTSAVGDGTGGVYVAWDTYIPPCVGHGCGEGTWMDSFAYVRGGQVVWGATSGYALGSPALLPDGLGNAFGYYTVGFDARCVLWRPGGNLWNVPSPIHLWALRDAVGDGSGGALFLGEAGNEYRLFRLDAAGTTPAPWPAGGLPMGSLQDALPAGVKADMLGGALVLSNRRLPDERWTLHAQYVSNLGQAAPSWPADGIALRTTSEPTGRVAGFLDGRGGYLLFWIDPNDGSPVILGQRLCADPPVPLALSFAGYELEGGVLRLRWHAAEGFATQAVVERREGPDESWTTVGTARLGSDGDYLFVDSTVRPGQGLDYRLFLNERGEASYSSPVRVEIPEATLQMAIDLPHQPMRPGDRIRLTLPDRLPARLDIFDARGRRTWQVELAGQAAGVQEHVLPAIACRTSGVYWLRLSQGSESRTARVVFLD